MSHARKHGIRCAAFDDGTAIHHRHAPNVLGNDADAHRPLRLEAEAIADAIARARLLRGDDLGCQRHRRPEAESFGATVSKGRAAVKHDSGAHPIAARFGKADQRRRVCERANAAERFCQAGEALKLRGDARCTIRIGEMRHER